MTGDAKETDKLKSRGGALPSKRLVSGERMVWEGRPTWITFLVRPALLFVLTIGIAVLAWSVAGQGRDMKLDTVFVLIIMIFLAAIIVVTNHHKTGIGLVLISMILGIVVLFYGDLVPLLLIPVVLVVISFAIYYLIWNHIAFALTDRRLMSQYGIFSLRYADTQINRVQNVTVIQPWWERALGYGDVMFATAGERGGVDYARPGLRMDRDGTLVWEDVPRPFELRRKVEEVLYSTPASSASAINPPPTNPPPAPTAAQPTEVEAKLLQLQQMKDKGLINEAEYEAKRKEILGRL